VLSDAHGDIRALQSVEKIAMSPTVGGFDDVWFLGDVFGRCNGNDVNNCLEWLHEHSAVCILGNHEWWVLTPELDPNNETTKLTTDQRFRKRYWDEIVHYREWLKENENWYNYIKTWPDYLELGCVTLVHGSPLLCSVEGHMHCSTPYLEYNEQVEQIFGTPKSICRVAPIIKTANLFVGHHHSPYVFYYRQNRGARMPRDPLDKKKIQQFPLAIDGWRTAIRLGTVSPGALREKYPTACAMIYDDQKNNITIFEVIYG